jgi:hypothetical protein
MKHIIKIGAIRNIAILAFSALIVLSFAGCFLDDLLEEKDEIKAGDNGVEKTVNITFRDEAFSPPLINNAKAQVTILKEDGDTVAVARSKSVPFTGSSVSLPLYEASGSGDNGNRWTGTGNYFVRLDLSWMQTSRTDWHRENQSSGTKRYTFNGATANFVDKRQIPPLHTFLDSN